ncbi:MAG: OmpA family protein [Mucilaginibacter sp.]
MKRTALILFLLLNCWVARLYAQVDSLRKPSTLVFHVAYIDFNTVRQIQTTSFSNVINNNLWSNISDMQTAFGLTYLVGLSKNIDFTAAVDGSATDYLFKDNTYNGSNKFLLDANVGVNIKLLSDRHTIVPYVSVGAGFSMYQGKTGVYIPIGAGLQFNVFNQAFVFTNMQYNRGLTSFVNNYMQYSIGVGTCLVKRKKAAPFAKPVTLPLKADTTPVIAKTPVKNLVITVTDLQTGLPLPLVEVTVNSPDGKLTMLTDATGKATFNQLKAADYTVSGTLNGIATTGQQLLKAGFDIAGADINLAITQNDPRFTLTGTVINKGTHTPEGNVSVGADNLTQNSSNSAQSLPGSGVFSLQLAAESDFVVSGKKAGYISNIEKVSTKGLTRSTTLYVKLELGVEQALPDKTIMLSNIYYDTGSSKIKPIASSDLEKLVKFLKDNPDVKIEIDSHTDSRGSAILNMKLSQARAQEVDNYLQKNGIDKTRLIPKGYGATKLTNGCKPGIKCTEAQHEQNRRTEFKVVGG